MRFEIRQRTLTILNALGIGVSGVAFTVAGIIQATHIYVALGLMCLGLVSAGGVTLITGLAQIRTEATLVRENALTSLVELAHQLCELDGENDLRVTLMTIDHTYNPAELRQVVRCGCVGPQVPGENFMTIHQGVAGLTLRRMQGKVTSVIVNIDPGNFENQMVDLGFTKEEAKKFNERGSYLCTPVVDSKSEGIAVLCLDAKKRDSFGPEHVKAAERVTPFFVRFLTAFNRSGGEDG
jgi:hypothetical protein